MDTKERTAPPRRRRPAGSGAVRTKAANPARTRSATRQSKPVRHRRRRSAASTASQKRTGHKRVVRAPRENIPEAVYTMPQTLHYGKFLLRLASVAAVVIAMMMAVSIFFRVDTVSVLGTDKYTPWMIQEASGIQQGDALLTLSRARAAGKIRSALPYVDQVKIDIELPGTVRIELTELEATYAIEATNNTWWLISASGEAIEQIDSTAASGYTRIVGVKADGPRVNQVVAAAEDAIPTGEANDETEQTEEAEADGQPEDSVTVPTQAIETNRQRLQACLSILQTLESNGVIGQVVSVNVASLTDIQLQYGQRFQVKLGNTDRLDYKIGYMAQAVKQMEEYQAGVLDVSFEYREQGIFTPDA